MMTASRILAPVDFSEHSGRALDCAKTLAEKFGASLHLLTVVPNPFALPDPVSWYVPLPEGYAEGLRQDAESHLRGLLTQANRRNSIRSVPSSLAIPTKRFSIT